MGNLDQMKKTFEEIGDKFETERLENLAMSKEEFCRRFKARMLKTGPEVFKDGSSVARYADETAPTYWHDPGLREDGPEDCADTDMSYWGE